jgi:hypothetical protein
VVEQNHHNTQNRSKNGIEASSLAIIKHGATTQLLKPNATAEKHGTTTQLLKTNATSEKHGTDTHPLKTNDQDGTLLHRSKALVQQKVSSAEQEARHIQKWSQRVTLVLLWIMREQLIQNKLLGWTPRRTNLLLLLIMREVYINDFVQLAQTTDPDKSAAAPASSPSRHSLRFSHHRQSPDMRVRAHSPKKKLAQRDGLWAVRKERLGWVLDWAQQFIELPQDKVDKLTAEIH